MPVRAAATTTPNAIAMTLLGLAEYAKDHGGHAGQGEIGRKMQRLVPHMLDPERRARSELAPGNDRDGRPKEVKRCRARPSHKLCSPGHRRLTLSTAFIMGPIV